MLEKYNIEERLEQLEITAREREGFIYTFDTAFDRICIFIKSHFLLI